MNENIPTDISLMSSSISGALHIIMGYPFDTIKTLRQSNKKLNISQTPFKRYFQGIKYPLLQNSFINSFCFGLNNYFMNNIENKTIGHLLTACVSTIILTPFDKFKIMSQYNANYDVNMRTILKSYHNLHIVSACEVPSTFLYFYVYQKMKAYEYPIFLCGGIAGMSSWIFTYPIDTIKTRMQNESCKTIKQAFKRGSLCSGLSVCLARSFFVNGINFYSYESITNLFMKMRTSS